MIRLISTRALFSSLACIAAATVTTSPAAWGDPTLLCKRTGRANEACCERGLNPTWWCASEDLRWLGNDCTITLQNGATRRGSRFACPGESRLTPVLNPFQAALLKANAGSAHGGPVDCVHNARDTLLRSGQPGASSSFRSVEDIVSTLIPRGVSAKVIGTELVRNWHFYGRRQAARGMRGWHAVDGKAYRRDHGRMWPNGIVFSGGTRYGHVSIHVQGRDGRAISLDQYSTRVLGPQGRVLDRALAGALGRGERTTTQPALAHRVDEQWLFQWCNEDWGCPSSAYWLEH